MITCWRRFLNYRAIKKIYLITEGVKRLICAAVSRNRQKGAELMKQYSYGNMNGITEEFSIVLSLNRMNCDAENQNGIYNLNDMNGKTNKIDTHFSLINMNGKSD